MCASSCIIDAIMVPSGIICMDTCECLCDYAHSMELLTHTNSICDRLRLFSISWKLKHYTHSSMTRWKMRRLEYARSGTHRLDIHVDMCVCSRELEVKMDPKRMVGEEPSCTCPVQVVHVCVYTVCILQSAWAVCVCLEY